jgi:hypothetical protein
LNAYCKETGRIAKGLYGVGIAFPKTSKKLDGTAEFQIGLADFMRHITLSLVAWIND